MRELRNTKIIAVDHGYGNMKTANTVTPTGIKAYETEPIFTGNILESKITMDENIIKISKNRRI